MAVAFFMVKFPNGWNPLLNQGELAVLYAFAFLYIATRGSGIWSLDALRKQRPPAHELTGRGPALEGSRAA